MRILFVSDSHGDRSGIQLAAERLMLTAPLDAALHLGDGAADFVSLTAWFQRQNPNIILQGVRGNCDFSGDVPEEAELLLGGARIFMTHGHRFYVKSSLDWLDEEARNRDCTIALFGHTHQRAMEIKRTLLLNPGSIMDGHFGLLEIDNGRPRVQLMDLGG